MIEQFSPSHGLFHSNRVQGKMKELTVAALLNTCEDYEKFPTIHLFTFLMLSHRQLILKASMVSRQCYICESMLSSHDITE
jgi:hypothetical protein